MNNYIPRVISGLSFAGLAYAGFSNKPDYVTMSPTDYSEDVKTMCTLVQHNKAVKTFGELERESTYGGNVEDPYIAQYNTLIKDK